MSPEIEGNVVLALGLTLFAGLSTGLGSLVLFFARRPSISLLSFGLGVSGGVMIYVSLVELLPVASDLMAESLGHQCQPSLLNPLARVRPIPPMGTGGKAVL